MYSFHVRYVEGRRSAEHDQVIRLIPWTVNFFCQTDQHAAMRAECFQSPSKYCKASYERDQKYIFNDSSSAR